MVVVVVVSVVVVVVVVFNIKSEILEELGDTLGGKEGVDERVNTTIASVSNSGFDTVERIGNVSTEAKSFSHVPMLVSAITSALFTYRTETVVIEIRTHNWIEHGVIALVIFTFMTTLQHVQALTFMRISRQERGVAPSEAPATSTVESKLYQQAPPEETARHSPTTVLAENEDGDRRVTTRAGQCHRDRF